MTAAVLRDALDDRVRTDEQAAATVGVSVVGSVVDGSAAGGTAMTPVRDVSSVSMDSYRRLRTNVSTLAPTDGVRLLMTSAAAERATSRAVVGLGVAFAEAGRSVVLVDANLWRPKLSDLLGIPPSNGLTGVLLDGVPVEGALHQWEGDPQIEVLPAGAQVLPASDVLSSRRLAGVLDSPADRADVVIVDSPALLKATDAAVLAPLTSGVLLLTRLSSTRAQQLEAAVRELDTVGAEIFGLVTIRSTRSRGWSRRNGSRAPASAAQTAGPVGVRPGGGR